MCWIDHYRLSSHFITSTVHKTQHQPIRTTLNTQLGKVMLDDTFVSLLYWLNTPDYLITLIWYTVHYSVKLISSVTLLVTSLPLSLLDLSSDWLVATSFLATISPCLQHHCNLPVLCCVSSVLCPCELPPLPQPTPLRVSTATPTGPPSVSSCQKLSLSVSTCQSQSLSVSTC